jgi:hypothetical protein
LAEQQESSERPGELTVTVEITDDTVMDYLLKFDEQDRSSRAAEALKVGVIAIQSASPSLDTRVVEEKFRLVEKELRENVESFRKDLQDRLQEYFMTEGGKVPLFIERHFGDDGKVSRILDSYFSVEKGRLVNILEGKVGPDSYLGRQMDPSNREGILSKIEKTVEEIVRENSREILSSFSLDEEDSSISRLKRSIREEIEKLQKMTGEHYSEIRELLGIEKGKTLEAVRGTGKGLDFENALYEYIAGLCLQMDDESENVSGSKGLVAYEKVGDYVARMGETSRSPGSVIVFEAKKAGKYNLKKTLDELDRAKKNRGATTGIFIFAKGYEPVETRDFYRSGSDFIVTVDEEKLARGDNLIFLESAYRIARTLIAAKASEEEKSEIDTGFINAEVENITTAMKNVSDIYTKAGTIRNSADAIEKTLNKFLDKVQDHLDNIRSHLPC